MHENSKPSSKPDTNLLYQLSGTELRHYREEGFLIRPAVFQGDELAGLIDAVEAAVSRAHGEVPGGKTYFLDGRRFVDVDAMTVQYEHQPGSETIKVIEPAHHLDTRLDQLVRDPRITQPVRDIIGASEIGIWTNKLNLKRGEEGTGFGWHQDSPYWVHDCQHVDLLPNVYLAFDEATRDNGCLKVIRRSHLQGCLPGTDNGTQLGGFYTDPNCFDESDEVLLEAPAGSLVFFDPHTIHGSEPNRTTGARRAMVMTYQPAGFPTLKTGQVLNI